ncbi:MAG: general secretion pathway protein GspK [Alphaproteobacteria bacterium]|nr:MAG: general secretion pathway protein GspK [Alphaproteobacteria bacterium]
MPYRRDDGFALIIVLWTLVLIAFIVAHVTANGRTEIRIAGNMVSEAAAEAADDGAIVVAIFNLLDPNPDQRWPLDGSPHEVRIGSSRVMLRLQDESGRINPNSAPPELLEALLRVTGSDPGSARELAAAIGEWVGSTGTGAPQQGQPAAYRAAGLDYGPPGEPLETIDELGRVLGMTPAVLAAIRPHLTLLGPAQPNPLTADPIVTAALAEIRVASQVPAPANQTPENPVIVRITASALGPSNARVQRSAIIRVGAALPGGYTVLAWGSGLD